MNTKWGKDFSLRVGISIQWSQKSNKMRAIQSSGFGGKVVVLGRLHLPLKIHCVSFSVLLCAQKRLISHISSTAFPCPLASSWVWIIGGTEEREENRRRECPNYWFPFSLKFPLVSSFLWLQVSLVSFSSKPVSSSHFSSSVVFTISC